MTSCRSSSETASYTEFRPHPRREYEQQTTGEMTDLRASWKDLHMANRALRRSVRYLQHTDDTWSVNISYSLRRDWSYIGKWEQRKRMLVNLYPVFIGPIDGLPLGGKTSNWISLKICCRVGSFSEQFICSVFEGMPDRNFKFNLTRPMLCALTSDLCCFASDAKGTLIAVFLLHIRNS